MAESSTVARERRRVAVAAREAVQALTPILETNSMKSDIALEMLREIGRRLDNLDTRVHCLEGRMPIQPPPGFEHQCTRDPYQLASRLDRLELLLFRMPLFDFERLDKHIAVMSQAASNCKDVADDSANASEPEQEQTPNRRFGCEIDKVQGVITNAKCSSFDISDPDDYMENAREDIEPNVKQKSNADKFGPDAAVTLCWSDSSTLMENDFDWFASAQSHSYSGYDYNAPLHAKDEQVVVPLRQGFTSAKACGPHPGRQDEQPVTVEMIKQIMDESTEQLLADIRHDLRTSF